MTERTRSQISSIPDASWTPPSEGVPGTSHKEEAQRTAQDMLEELCLSAGLGMPWDSPGRAGGSVCGEGRLYYKILFCRTEDKTVFFDCKMC
ncbi:hypothetical protein ILYODFUR_027883 [Ilyodon furcidens]|uniref:Uncharacterized protein n=1 Tax=Ilyodon furcidens TaxID=33524 RepID=A0ABV0TMA4_9TELE